MKTTTFLLILSTLVSTASTARAEKMDSETQTVVISRIQHVLGGMEKNDSSYIPTSLRLADLLSERARLRAMAEVEQGCEGCKGSPQDRQEALHLYGDLLPRVKSEQQGTVLLQMAHLYDMAGQDSKAAELFESILKTPNKFDPELVGQARVALADQHFSKNDYKKALPLYQMAYANKKSPNRGLILYRISWCYFNMDQLNEAISHLETLAMTDSLLTKDTADGSKPDSAFHADVMRDLATFYSRRKISAKEIDTYQKLIPAGERKELLFFFAGEADRLGQKSAAADIYRLYLSDPKLTKEERLEAFVLMAQVNYDKGGQTGQSTKDFESAAESFKSTSCKDQKKCDEIQAKMKHYVTELHRAKKTKPDMDVLKAYAIYAKTFPADTEMAIRGAQVANQVSQPGMAVVLYRHASKAATDPKLREDSLLGEISSAEAANDLSLREQAYQNYLDMNPHGAKAFDVRYQLAHLSYERKDYAKSSGQFHTLALDRSGSADLRKKSADLALDSLAIQKRDEDIETYAAEFSEAFPAAKAEFAEISRKALMNQVANTTNNEKSSKSELRQALARMQTLSVARRSDADKIVHYRDESLLAEKVGDDRALMESLNGLLAVTTLKPDEREATLGRKVGYYERRLDFKDAYATALKMRFPKTKPAERELRLGTLADLSGLKPQKHYEAALHAGLSGKAAASVRSRLVLLSSNPVAELGRQRHELEKDPALFGQTVIQVAGRTGNSRGLEPFFASKALAHTAVATLLKSQPSYGRGQSIAEKLAAHKIDSRSDRTTQKSIKQRVALLKEADQYLDEAVHLNDFTAKVLALSTVQRENTRMVKDLASLPLPAGLKREEKTEYQDALKTQTRPFLVKAKLAEQQLKNLWENQTLISAIQKDFEDSRAEVRPLLAPRIRILASLAPGWSQRLSLDGDLKESLPTREQLLAARESVRENPDDTKALEKLKILETKIGHPLMSSYLDARLEQIQKEKM